MDLEFCIGYWFSSRDHYIFIRELYAFYISKKFLSPEFGESFLHCVPGECCLDIARLVIVVWIASALSEIDEFEFWHITSV